MGQSRSCKTSQQIFDQIRNNWIYLNSLISNSAEMVGESQLFMLESGIQLPSSWVPTTFSGLDSTWHWGLTRGSRVPTRNNSNISPLMSQSPGSHQAVTNWHLICWCTSFFISVSHFIDKLCPSSTRSELIWEQSSVGFLTLHPPTTTTTHPH